MGQKTFIVRPSNWIMGRIGLSAEAGWRRNDWACPLPKGDRAKNRWVGMQKRKLRIRLQKSTKSRLKRLKLIERETYEEVLSRVVEEAWEAS